MKAHHGILLFIAGTAFGWLINNIAYSGAVTPIFPTSGSWFPGGIRWK